MEFSTWTFCKNICVVFLNTPYRDTPKDALKTKPREKLPGVGWFLGI
jgi:hypothetical protein